MVADEEARRAAAEILGAEEFTRWHTDYEAWLGLLERIAELIPDWLIDLLGLCRHARKDAAVRVPALVKKLYESYAALNESTG